MVMMATASARLTHRPALRMKAREEIVSQLRHSGNTYRLTSNDDEFPPLGRESSQLT